MLATWRGTALSVEEMAMVQTLFLESPLSLENALRQKRGADP